MLCGSGRMCMLAGRACPTGKGGAARRSLSGPGILRTGHARTTRRFPPMSTRYSGRDVKRASGQTTAKPTLCFARVSRHYRGFGKSIATDLLETVRSYLTCGRGFQNCRGDMGASTGIVLGKILADVVEDHP